jgi:hypothetical protein
MKQKDDSLLFTGNLSSLSSKFHIKLNTHPLVLNFGTQQHIPTLSSHAKSWLKIAYKLIYTKMTNFSLVYLH